jgi:hypothetical protein
MMDRLKSRAMSTQKLFNVALSLVATDYINSQTIEYEFESNRNVAVIAMSQIQYQCRFHLDFRMRRRRG